MKIVVIGGGTGTFTVLTGLKKYPDVLPSAIVSMADDGGSTGALRTSMGALPPGDVRRALIALSEVESEESLIRLFNYRFPSEAAEGHSFGNLFLAALEKMLGSFDAAVEEASRILKVRGKVVPVTLDDVRLHAICENGLVVDGETNIDVPKHNPFLKIFNVWLDPPGVLNPKACKLILEADAVVIGPGDLYTSIVPNLLVRGMPEAIRHTKAAKIFVVNLMTKAGETHGFRVHDFVEGVEGYMGKGILTHVLYNIVLPDPEYLHVYRTEGAEFVRCDTSILPQGPKYIAADVLASNPLIRHDPDKLAKHLVSIVEERHESAKRFASKLRLRAGQAQVDAHSS